jgi:hypothetical protein
VRRAYQRVDSASLILILLLIFIIGGAFSLVTAIITTAFSGTSCGMSENHAGTSETRIPTARALDSGGKHLVDCGRRIFDVL